LEDYKRNLLQEYIERYGVTHLIGLDECGYGSLAGPVTVAVAVYPVEVTHIEGVRDSKKYYSEKSREKAFRTVQDTALYVGYQSASPGNILVDGMSNTLHSILKIAAERAISHYPRSLVVFDGKHTIRNLSHPQLAIVKADNLVPVVAAASVAGKVNRDTYMTQLGKELPEFKFENHKGYTSKEHLDAMNTYGITEHHRTSIALVKEIEERVGVYKGSDDSKKVSGF
jgi:ribonuclease HII